MNIKILKGNNPGGLMRPLSDDFPLQQMPLAGADLSTHLRRRVAVALAKSNIKAINLVCDLWPSEKFLSHLCRLKQDTLLVDKKGNELGQVFIDSVFSGEKKFILTDSKTTFIVYPWDILALNEEIVRALDCNKNEGTIREGVTVDGFCHVGSGSVLLPGVYIEGNVIIGKNCKIGPNCYIRGNTAIGDNCHVGQAVEIKNSLLMNGASAGHLSYIGDSIIGENTNLGAGTITANLRHDGKDQRSIVERRLVDTKRRKLGTIIGANVHTGIHTSIYPGRKIASGASTLPGEVVSRDIGFY